MKYIIACFLLLLMGNVISQVTIKKTDVKCKGSADGTLVASVAGAAEPVKSYVWNDGVNAKSRNKVRAGTYCVTVTDANDCTGTQCATIEEPESQLRLTLELQPIEITVPCNEPQPVWLIAHAQGGKPPYSINGQVGISRTWRITSTTTVNVVVRDDYGCQKEKEQRVYILPRLCPRDPNEIVGPIGVDSVHWVSVKDTLDYNVKFENDPIFATVPAQRVTITHQFDEDINPFSFRLGSFGFGNYSFDVPDNVAYYQERLDLVDSIGLFVDVTAGLNVTTQTAFWTFESIDPFTGLQPNNPFIGFLPVNDTLSRGGEGFLNFSVRPYLPGHTGDTVHATASIVFDLNEPIITNTWTNWIDAVPPITHLAPLDSVRNNKLIELEVSGEDDPNGSGLDHYELWVSANDAVFQRHDITIPDSLSSYVFEGEYGTVYAFYILGVDRTGNVEVKTGAEATSEILPRQEINLIQPIEDAYCIGDTLPMIWETISIDSVDLYISLDSGLTYVFLEGPFTLNDTMTYLILDDTLANAFISLKYKAHQDTFEVVSQILQIKGLPEVSAGSDKSICVGSYTHLVPSGANMYHWAPNIHINNPALTIPTVTPDSTTTYYLTGTDAFGCINTDEVIVNVHPTYLDTNVYVMCNQDSIFVGGSYQTDPGFYTDELTSAFGCDSTVVTEVILTGPCTFPSPQVYVDEDATGLNNGTSWANAFVELKDALEVAGEWANANVIWIAEGVYTPHDTRRDTSFILHDSIKIYGGFLGFEASLAERTPDPELVQISGDINIADTLWDNCYHTVILSSDCQECVIDGVTITYGHADEAINADNIGAGVLNQGVGHFDNVVFERNYATDLGAAVYSSGAGANLIIENCLFRLNTSSLGRDVVNLNGAQVEFRGANGIH